MTDLARIEVQPEASSFQGSLRLYFEGDADSRRRARKWLGFHRDTSLPQVKALLRRGSTNLDGLIELFFDLHSRRPVDRDALRDLVFEGHLTVPLCKAILVHRDVGFLQRLLCDYFSGVGSRSELSEVDQFFKRTELVPELMEVSEDAVVGAFVSIFWKESGSVLGFTHLALDKYPELKDKVLERLRPRFGAIYRDEVMHKPEGDNFSWICAAVRGNYSMEPRGFFLGELSEGSTIEHRDSGAVFLICNYERERGQRASEFDQSTLERLDWFLRTSKTAGELFALCPHFFLDHADSFSDELRSSVVEHCKANFLRDWLGSDNPEARPSSVEFLERVLSSADLTQYVEQLLESRARDDRLKGLGLLVLLREERSFRKECLKLLDSKYSDEREVLYSGCLVFLGDREYSEFYRGILTLGLKDRALWNRSPSARCEEVLGLCLSSQKFFDDSRNIGLLVNCLEAAGLEYRLEVFAWLCLSGRALNTSDSSMLTDFLLAKFEKVKDEASVWGLHNTLKQDELDYLAELLRIVRIEGRHFENIGKLLYCKLISDANSRTVDVRWNIEFLEWLLPQFEGRRSGDWLFECMKILDYRAFNGDMCHQDIWQDFFAKFSSRLIDADYQDKNFHKFLLEAWKIRFHGECELKAPWSEWIKKSPAFRAFVEQKIYYDLEGLSEEETLGLREDYELALSSL